MDSETVVIKIRLNGVELATEVRTLHDLVAAGPFGGGRIATAVNGRFVPAAERASTVLAAGDKVEVVSPRQGG